MPLSKLLTCAFCEYRR